MNERVLAGRYRLLERIDEGGAGEVWRARDERLDRDVAIKILGAQADEGFRERFTQEARRAAVVAHPNVVTVFDEGQDGDTAFIVMEHVRGRTLREIVRDRGALAPLEAARIVAQVADALDAAHYAGVIHCDVKPANVIVDERGTAKLTDFGVARAARDAEERELLATPRYLAPERVEGGPATAASDVYGLGLVAYELLAGEQPLAGMSTNELLRERLEGAPPSLRGQPGVSPDVDVVVARALARDPARRYQTAGAFARDLLAAARGEHTRTMPVMPPPIRVLPRERRAIRVDAVLALLAVAGVVLAVALLFMGFPGVPAIIPSAPSPSPSATAALTPNVVGKDLLTAVRELRAAGYLPVAWGPSSASGNARACSVVKQDPAAGSPLRKGTPASVEYAPASGCTRGLP